MKITKLEYKNNDIFGNLTIDLSKKDGTAYDKIIIIGENGAGKTTILNDLNKFLSVGGLKFSEIEYLNDNDEEIFLKSNENSLKHGFYDIILKDGKTMNVFGDKSDLNIIKTNEFDIRKNGVVYSKVQVNFKTNIINNVSSSDIDSEEIDNEDYDFTNLKQLIIDLYDQDARKFVEFSKKENISYYDFEKDNSKLLRFRKAFDNFFDSLRFEKVDTIKGHQEVYFIKNSRSISIDDLSTGEKQIVFRGVYILKNIDLHGNGFVLIDEPEISMHPIWEDKIFKYYSDLLFSSKNPIGQLFIATHSERILKQALNDNNTLIVEIKNDNGNIICNRYDSSLILPYKSDAEIKYKIFGIYSNDLHLQLYDLIQKKLTKTKNVKGTDEFIEKYNTPGYFDKTIHGIQTTHGRTTYETICTAIRNNLHHGTPDQVDPKDLKLSIDLMYKICEDLKSKGKL